MIRYHKMINSEMPINKNDKHYLKEHSELFLEVG